jgi:hypothetical protein
MTTIDRLDSWKEAGVITDGATYHPLRDRSPRSLSLFVELNALLYIGVCPLSRDSDGRSVTTSPVSATSHPLDPRPVDGCSFGYCFVRGPRTRTTKSSRHRSRSITSCISPAWSCGDAGLHRTRFAIFHGWDTHLLIAALVFGVLAYRFDNRFVLSLALSTLAGYLGLKSRVRHARHRSLRFAGFLYGAS